jgi:hypothetical protein
MICCKFHIDNHDSLFNAEQGSFNTEQLNLQLLCIKRILTSNEKCIEVSLVVLNLLYLHNNELQQHKLVHNQF